MGRNTVHSIAMALPEHLVNVGNVEYEETEVLKAF